MAMVLTAFVSNFSNRLVQMGLDKVRMLVGVPDEIEKLKRIVGDIQAVLADAEEKQFKSQQIERWLLELKDVMYDADDIIDLYQFKCEEALDRSDSPSTSKFSSEGVPSLKKICIRHDIGVEIKEINKRLEEIAKRKADLGLIETQGVVLPEPPSHIRRPDSFILRMTDSLVVMDDLVGDKIENNAQLLVSWLIEELKTNIGVVAIHGMGGIGKTTLAKRIFNDPRIEKEFELRIWACVSKDVNGVELLKSIIQQVGGAIGVAEERQVLVSKLQEVIKGKKFLLVLDDVWPESLSVWDDLLRAAMNGGSPGSRLLVTTRDERVVKGVNATKSHRVGKLSDEDGWLLLKKQVFQNEEESEIEEFQKIGFELVRKCDGLPLAIKSIGGVLRTKSKETPHWEAILRSNMWSTNGLPEDIHRALYLSYEDLRPPLKQCFIICSLYPEDYFFQQIELVYHWIAEGFLQGSENPWAQGIEYYNELLVRNLLENSRKEDGSSKMHDLLWSFAQHLGKNENCILTKGQVLNRQERCVKLRRFSTQEANVNLADVLEETGLRTLFVQEVLQKTLINLCETISNLRILILKKYKFSTLPDSLSNLVHLRYLDVSHSKITTIPESLGLLRNLVYLDFSFCLMLTHVPRNITNLKKLMHLSFAVTQVEGIPSGLKNFEELTHLSGFKPRNHSLNGLSGLGELEPLLHLVTLELDNLENVYNINTAKKAKLCHKEQLQKLYFCFSKLFFNHSVLNEKKVTAEGVLNELCPPRSIKSLKINGYFGSTLPNWFNFGANLPNLRELCIEYCPCFESLAPFGQLPNLEFLRIAYVRSIVTVGEEFLWRDINKEDTKKLAFRKLTILEFISLPNWKEWQWNKGVSAMPKLKKLCISDCPKLKSLPGDLSYHASDSLEYSIRRCQNLERISNFSGVSSIGICECPNLKTVEVDNLSSLQTMTLFDNKIEALPEFLMTLAPSKLTIGCKEELWRQITSQGKNGSEWHKFEHIPNVSISSWNGTCYLREDVIQLHYQCQ